MADRDSGPLNLLFFFSGGEGGGAGESAGSEAIFLLRYLDVWLPNLYF